MITKLSRGKRIHTQEKSKEKKTLHAKKENTTSYLTEKACVLTSTDVRMGRNAFLNSQHRRQRRRWSFKWVLSIMQWKTTTLTARRGWSAKGQRDLESDAVATEWPVGLLTMKVARWWLNVDWIPENSQGARPPPPPPLPPHPPHIHPPPSHQHTRRPNNDVVGRKVTLWAEKWRVEQESDVGKQESDVVSRKVKWWSGKWPDEQESGVVSRRMTWWAGKWTGEQESDVVSRRMTCEQKSDVVSREWRGERESDSVSRRVTSWAEEVTVWARKVTRWAGQRHSKQECYTVSWESDMVSRKVTLWAAQWHGKQERDAVSRNVTPWADVTRWGGTWWDEQETAMVAGKWRGEQGGGVLSMKTTSRPRKRGGWQWLVMTSRET